MIKVLRYFFLVLFSFTFFVLVSCVEGNTEESLGHYEEIVLSMSNEIEYVDTIGDTIVGIRDGAVILMGKDGATLSEATKRDHVTNKNGLLECWNSIDEDEYYHIGGVSILPDQLVAFGTEWQALDSLNPFKSNDGLYGYVNKQGFITIEPQFMFGGRFAEGLAYVSSKDGTTNGILNMNGEFTSLCLQNDVGWDSVFSDGRLLLKSFGDDRHPTVSTYITKENTILGENLSPATTYSIGYPFFCAEGFQEGLAAVQRGDYWGYIDITGEFAINPHYKRAYSFSAGNAVVVFDDNSYGRIDKFGNAASEANKILDFEVQGEYYDGQYLVMGKDGYNLLNEDGSLALAQSWSGILLEEPFWYLFDDNMSTFCYTKGIETPQATFGFVEKDKIFQNTVVLGTSGQTLINYKTGEVLATSKRIGSWGEQLLPVADKHGKMGYMDATGTFIIEPQFDRAESFKSGIAYVTRNGECGFIANPLLFKSGWEANELRRASALGIPEINKDINIPQTEFIYMLNGGCKKLNELAFIDDIAQTPVLPSGENMALTWREACLILGNYLKKLGAYTERLYVPDNISRGLSQEETDALGLLASMGILRFSQFRSDVPMTYAEARVLILKFCETIV